ncbi:galacturonokinase-like isoform X1 [Panicum virgatum]|uniref:galacturonokinase-like isoform X1 n=2 Tax=Panicum virgatum TaxID=38727 RepID=UPI0019D618DE|nr:galacturonokinase-like isoform X1 [Panicum virgatum]
MLVQGVDLKLISLVSIWQCFLFYILFVVLQLEIVRKIVVEISGRDEREVKVAACPYRICPLGAHIDHQGGIVTTMTINYGVLLGFVPSNDSEVLLQSGQFEGVIRFRVDDLQKPIDNPENINWESYARGAVYALQNSGYDLRKGIIGYISGVKGLDSSGLSSSAAVGIAYLLALENVNDLVVSSVDNIQLDKSIENKYLGLENGILDPSAILLSQYGYLTFMDCKTASPSYVYFSELSKSQQPQGHLPFNILLAFSGLQHNLPKKRGYNTRVFECKEAACALLHASGCEEASNILRNVDSVVYEAQKCVLEENLSRRAEHYFSEMKRVAKGRDAWARGNLQELGQLISASGRSSILNYECGSKEMIQLYKILLKAPGVLGARFSGAGFRGCCLAIVESDRAKEAAWYVAAEYEKAQPELVSRIPEDRRVLVCEPGDSARVILPDDRLHS